MSWQNRDRLTDRMDDGIRRPNTRSKSCIILPSYNSGSTLKPTVSSVTAQWPFVWVIIDASTDGSGESITPFERPDGAFLRRIVLGVNAGKGGAVLEGLRAAADAGFSHALVMDADGQHDPASIERFMEASMADPGAMILGVPRFGPEAPIERVRGRRIGNWFTQLDTLWLGIEDSLFGFRVYPVSETLKIMQSIRTARRFDFDTEVAVRLVWAGVRPVNLTAPVSYPSDQHGGVTHFHYLRDNVLLIATHARLILGMVVRIPKLLRYRKAWKC